MNSKNQLYIYNIINIQIKMTLIITNPKIKNNTITVKLQPTERDSEKLHSEYLRDKDKNQFALRGIMNEQNELSTIVSWDLVNSNDVDQIQR